VIPAPTHQLFNGSYLVTQQGSKLAASTTRSPAKLAPKISRQWNVIYIMWRVGQPIKNKRPAATTATPEGTTAA